MLGTSKLAVFAVIAVIAAAGCGSDEGGSGQGDTGKVGISTTLTGSLGDIGQGDRNGIELALKDLNSGGGVLGKQVSLVAQDDDLDPAKGSDNARSMIVDDDVKAIFGPVASSIATGEE